MLLILAGVSISLVVGDNGVLTRASTSSTATKYAQFKEACGIAINEVQTSYFENYAQNASTVYTDKINMNTIVAALNNQGYTMTTTKDGSTPCTGALGKGYIRSKEGSSTLSKDYVVVTLSKDGNMGVKAVFDAKLNSED